MQGRAKHLSQSGGTSTSSQGVQYYKASGSWNAYTHQYVNQANSGGDRSNAQAVPDDTSYRAKQAISEYLQTQFLEERFHFEQALGIDEYA